MRILVAYASKNGSTKSIAERLAETLSTKGHTVAVEDARKVKSIDGYEGVIVGGGIYANNWHAAARRLVKRIAKEASGLKRGAFAVCMAVADERPDERAKADKYMDAARASFNPDQTAVLAGVMDIEAQGWLMRKMLAKMGATSEDKRDWDKVDAWATEIDAAWSS